MTSAQTPAAGDSDTPKAAPTPEFSGGREAADAAKPGKGAAAKKASTKSAVAKKTTKATKATKAKAADSDAPASTDETRAAPNVETAETAASSDTGSNEPTDAVDARAAGRDGGGLRVVVAEDEALIRLDLAEMLEEAGYEVVGQAPDGQQAVELVREHKPDLVVMDVKMPVLDGISAAEIVGSEHLAPVVMLTAFSDKTLVERARDAGVMAYVVKPFTIDDLRPAIDIARSRWDEIRALESEIADLGERLETRKAVDRAKGVLMTQLKLSEPDAFRWIQKTAMDRRLGMREVAEAVINGLPGKR
ncbi:response regulator NasT [Kineosphaera limosa]|nr:response regulator NasT [Kineosphaera limosa]